MILSAFGPFNLCIHTPKYYPFAGLGFSQANQSICLLLRAISFSRRMVDPFPLA